MRWEIVGADSRTGKEVKVTFEADDQSGAEHLANYNGIFVSSTRQLDKVSAAAIKGAREAMAAQQVQDKNEPDQGPGKYRVYGVDWTTGMRTTWYVTTQ